MAEAPATAKTPSKLGGFAVAKDSFYEDKKVILQTVERNATFASGASNPALLTFGVPFYQYIRTIYLKNAEIPNVINITPSNATGSFQFVANAGTVNITMPTGAPATGTALAAQLQTLLAAVDAGTTVTYDTYTRKLTITDPLKANFQIKFPASKVGYRNAVALGFRPPLPKVWADNTYLADNTFTAAANVLTSTVPVNLAGPTTIFLKINGVKQEADTTAGFEFQFPITVTANYGSMIDWNANNKWHQSAQNINPTQAINRNNWTIELLDEFGQTIDMQYQDWSITLGITFWSGGN